MQPASLLVMPLTERGREAFVFDHDQAHRSLNSATTAPTKVTSAHGQNYLLDPSTVAQTARRAGNWHFDHQSAHNDFDLTFSSFRSCHILADSNLSDPGSLALWTFMNHHQHYIANQIP